MNTVTLLWVDLRHDKSNAAFHSGMSKLCEVLLFEKYSGLIKHIENAHPDIICFDYDIPNAYSLQALQQVKHTYPSIPILMMTEHHSEALAIWALRARVWDYLVKPVESVDICRRITVLSSMRSRNDGSQTRNLILPSQTDSLNAEIFAKNSTRRTVLPAINFFESHFHEKIAISSLAQLCNMSPSQFTRIFKQELGITVREYLITYRITQASDLLKHSTLCVGDVAFASGFPDHAYFSRIFRKHTGYSPSDYRLKESISHN